MSWKAAWYVKSTGASPQNRNCGKYKRWKPLGNSLGGIAHDFNNILSVIIANAEMIEQVYLRATATGGWSRML